VCWTLVVSKIISILFFIIDSIVHSVQEN
jgi:hypothetical protein